MILYPQVLSRKFLVEPGLGAGQVRPACFDPVSIQPESRMGTSSQPEEQRSATAFKRGCSGHASEASPL